MLAGVSLSCCTSHKHFVSNGLVEEGLHIDGEATLAVGVESRNAVMFNC